VASSRSIAVVRIVFIATLFNHVFGKCQASLRVWLNN